MKKVSLLDLSAQYETIEREVRDAMDRVIRSQHFILGPEVEALESAVSNYVGCKYGIGVSSGSDALLMALMAMGVGPGDEVVTTPFTFFATAGAISRVGAKPVFVDIEPQGFNLDPKKLERALTAKTKAVIPIHLFGQAADMKPIMEICNQRKIPVIEDAAQAIGTEYQGKRACSFGLVSCLSFFPSKNLGAFGDAGMVTTNDGELAEKLKIFRSHGSKPKYYYKWIGGNFRIDAIQAAILNVKFKHLDGWSLKRQENAKAYDSLFEKTGLSGQVTTPWVRPGDRHIYNQYVIRAKNRDGLRKFLDQNGVATEIYYPKALHVQECFSYLGHKAEDFPESQRATEDSLAIPVYPEIPRADQEYVVETIKRFYQS